MSAGATICGFYGRNNLGDEAILAGMLDLLAHARPGESSLVMSEDPSATRSDHGVDTVSIKQRRGPRQLTDARLAQAVLRRRDFVLGGGDLVRDSPHQDVVGHWMGQLDRAQRLRRRSAVIGISVGDVWRDASVRRVKAALDRASFVVTRDEPSAARLREMGVQTEVVVGPDLALRVFPRRSGVREEGPRRQVLVSVRGLADRADKSSQSAYQHAVRQLAAALDALSATGADIHLVPLRSRSGRLQPVDDDYVASLELAHLAEKGHTFTIHRHVRSVTDLRILLTAADLVIGMRLHSVIMAAGLGVPAVALAYDPKVTQFCEEVGITSVSGLAEVDSAVIVDQSEERLSSDWEMTEHPKMVAYRERSGAVEARLRDW